jgi:hypothetical protein
MTITKLERIAWLSARDGHKRFDNVMHLFTEENLAECYRSLDGRKAVGADGVTKRMYGHLYVFVRSLIPREWRYLEPIARIGHDGF